MQAKVRQEIAAAVAAVIPGVDAPSIAVERAKRPEHGDFASNIALALAAKVGKRPRELAEQIARQLGESKLFELVDVAGPGFLNLRVLRKAWQEALITVVQAGRQWGSGQSRSNPRILLEHPSPNPTGPLHVGHGRIAAVGDSLARLLRFAGFDVATECYMNDHGSKIQLFAQSIAARARGQEPPPSGYRGSYVHAISEAAARAGVDLTDTAKLGDFGVDEMEKDMGCVLERFRARPANMVHERDLYARGDVKGTIEQLRQAGWLEERDSAIWFRSTGLAEAQDDKDRVVVRRTGEPTYFAADLAYHRDKFSRGYDNLINVLGADHHGHIARMRAGMQALGHNADQLEVLLVQIVTLLRGGKKVAMDKSAGEFVTLSEVIDEVGVDAARFFFLMRSHDTALDFDLELAKKRSLDNPVYYVQYAHARAAALKRRAKELAFEPRELTPALAARLDLPEELAIIQLLVGFPMTVADAAAAREPHRMVYFAQELASAFQSYYTRLQKVHDDPVLPQLRHREGDWRSRWDVEKTQARLIWVDAIQSVLASTLQLVGVDAPEQMERQEMEAENA